MGCCELGCRLLQLAAVALVIGGYFAAMKYLGG